MQLSIVHGHLAIVALQRGDVPAARARTEASEAFARQGDYRRGVAMNGLLRAELAARGGDAAAALATLAGALDAFAALGIVEGLNREFEGRVLRLLQRPGESKRALLEGLRISVAFPLQRGRLHAELARTHRMLGDDREAAVSAGQAADLFRACGAPRLAEAVRRDFGLR